MSRNEEYDGDEGTTEMEPADVPPRSAVRSTAATDARVEDIRESIEQTRVDMGQTIDELQGRLSPHYLKEQVKEQVIEQYNQVKESIREATIGRVEDMVERVSGTVYETRRSIVDTVTSNPVPAAMVGVGLAWLWMNRGDSAGRGTDRQRPYAQPGFAEPSRRYSGSGSYGTRRGGGDVAGRGIDADNDWTGGVTTAAGRMADQVRDNAASLAGKAKDTVSGAVDQAQQAAGYVADQAQYQARRAEQRFQVAMQEGPLAVGAIALAIGTAVGLALPQTRVENEWMGEARDTFVDKAQAVAGDAIEHVTQQATGESQWGNGPKKENAAL